MNLENTQAQMRKGILEYCILSILDKKKEAYPSEILDTLKEAKLIVVEGADGSGRSTQIARLVAWLEGHGHATVQVGLKRSTLVSEEQVFPVRLSA